MHKTCLALASWLFVSAAATGFAQQPWQHLQIPTAAEVQKAWQSPPPEYDPEPYYGLNGPVTLETVRHDLDTMHALGYQAVTVQYGYGASFAYLSPDYFAFFKQFVAEAKQRNMRVWIVDDADYPSGFAGGKFTELHPELRMQALALATRIPAKAGDEIRQTVAPETVAVTAVSTDGKTVPVSVTNSAIDWQAPVGDWTIMVVEHRLQQPHSSRSPHKTQRSTLPTLPFASSIASSKTPRSISSSTRVPPPPPTPSPSRRSPIKSKSGIPKPATSPQ